MPANQHGTKVRRVGTLILYLSSGWRTYLDVQQELGYRAASAGKCKSARRSVTALEEAGYPVEYRHGPDSVRGRWQQVRLPPDWVARTPWLRKYLQVKMEDSKR